MINQTNRTLEEMENVTLMWLPGHTGLEKSEKVDEMAKQATSTNEIITLEYTKSKVYGKIKEWIWKKWKKEWKAKITCKYQEVFQVLREGYQYQNMKRREETVMNRMRLQQTRLNAGLFKIGRHENGKCSTCNKIQDLNHFIMDCKETEDLRAILKDAREDEPLSLKEIFNSQSLPGILVEYTK